MNKEIFNTDNDSNSNEFANECCDSLLNVARPERSEGQHEATASASLPVPLHRQVQPIKQATKRYQIVYADPPWQYENYNYVEAVRGCEKEYRTMDIEKIKGMRIDNISADDCILFIWGVWALLPECLSVITAWGFNYKTLGFIWIKANRNKDINQYSFLPDDKFDNFIGMGNWTRSNTEYCLIGIKGKPKRIDASVRQVIYSPIREHSRKPDEARERIVSLMGDLPRVELFAREKSDGWDVFGNEVSESILLPV